MQQNDEEYKDTDLVATMTNSLAKRLTFRIMAVVVVMMTVITSIVYFSVREYMLEEAQQRYMGILFRMHEEFRRRLSDVYVAVKNNVHDIERDIDEPEKMYEHVERIMRLNPTISSSALMFSHDYYPELGEYFVPMGTRDSTGRIEVSRSESIVDYHEAPWYCKGLEADSGAWMGTLFDRHDVSESFRRRLPAMYATPIHDREGKSVAMLCVELSLKSMQRKIIEDIEEINEKFEKGRRHKSYCFVIDSEGTYVIHPDKERMLTELDNRMVAQAMKEKKGKAMIEVDGVPSWIYYRSIKYTDWTIVIVVPKDILFYNGRMLNTIILLVVMIALIAIYLICRRMISKITTPVTVAQAAMERELKIAHDIQMAMLPNLSTLKSPLGSAAWLVQEFSNLNSQIPIDLHASLTPARDVGGDLYDYYLRDNRLFFCIGDVSGKGMPAALMMAVMRAMFRSETRRADSATALVETMNRNLSEESTAGYFVTMFVGVLDLTTGHLDYCNAGHEAPILITNYELRRAKDEGQRTKDELRITKDDRDSEFGIRNSVLPVKPNLPVGALPDWVYEGQEAQLHAGDMLFLYTDGLSEAKNPSGQLFGRQQVLQIAASHSDDSAQQLVQTMEAEVHRHIAEAPQSDDITLLAIRWNGNRTLTMRASMDEIGQLQPYIESVARQAGIDGKETKRLRLAVEEAVVNVINYGQATTITLHSTVTDGQLLLAIDDDGVPFDPTANSATDLSLPPDQRPPGGMGIILLHKMTDGLSYQRTDGHNILTITKYKIMYKP